MAKRSAWFACASFFLVLPASPATPAAAVDSALEEKACNMGMALSCQVVGLMYLQGSGVPKDMNRAATYSRRACDGGNMLGCRQLGVLHAIGQGVAQDFAQAETLFRKACAGGDSPSCGLAEKAQADRQSMASPSEPARAPSSTSASHNPGHPVTPGGARCDNVELVDKEPGLGSTNYTRYTYKLSNRSGCAKIWIGPVVDDYEYNERLVAPGETVRFLCFHGLSHEPDCKEGLTGWTVRLAD